MLSFCLDEDEMRLGISMFLSRAVELDAGFEVALFNVLVVVPSRESSSSRLLF